MIARPPAAVRAAEIPVPSEVLPEVGVRHEPAVRAVAPAWAAAVAAEVAVVVGDGGR